MGRKWRKPGKRWYGVFGILAMLIAGLAGFTGCQAKQEEEEKIRDLEFTVVGENDVPAALMELIAKKKEKPFKLTYADGQDMYIVIGEGPKEGGGYSVAVRELYLTDNSVTIRTELLGPEKETAGADLSYPVLIVKTEFIDKPVVFR